MSHGAHNVLFLQASNALMPLMQEELMAEVLQHFHTRERLQLATVCRLWRACVANSWTTASLSGHDIKKQLAWLARCVPPRTLKVVSLKSAVGNYNAAAGPAHCASSAFYACRSW